MVSTFVKNPQLNRIVYFDVHKRVIMILLSMLILCIPNLTALSLLTKCRAALEPQPKN